MSKSPQNECVILDSLNTCFEQQVETTKSDTSSSSDALETTYHTAASVTDELIKVHQKGNKFVKIQTAESNISANSETSSHGHVESFQRSAAYNDGTIAIRKCCCVNEAVTTKCEKFVCVNCVVDRKSTPQNPTETLELVKNQLWNTVADVYNSNPGMAMAMFGSITYILFAAGLKYVHSCTQKNKEAQDSTIQKNHEAQNSTIQKSHETLDSKIQKNHEAQNSTIQKSHETLDSKIEKNTEALNSVIQKNHEAQNSTIQKSHETLDSKIQKNTEVQNIFVKEKVSELAAYTKEKLTDLSASVKENDAKQDKRIDEIATRIEKLAAMTSSTKEDNAKQDKRVDEIITRLERDAENRFTMDGAGITQAKLLEFQQTLLAQTLEHFQKLFNQEKNEGGKSNEEIFNEQELALRAAMERHSERVNGQLPKNFYYHYQQLQKATRNFSIYLHNESKKNIELGKNNENKSNEEIGKAMTSLKAVTKRCGEQFLGVMKPQVNFIVRRIRRLRRK